MGRILIVDDRLDQCVPLLRLLHRAGHSAACVSDGRSAIGMVRLSRPDLVLLDAMMPDMDGTEVLREIRRNPETRHVPVIVFSGVDDPGFREHVMGLGANDYWTKAGFDFDDMQRRFAAHLPPRRAAS